MNTFTVQSALQIFSYSKWAKNYSEHTEYLQVYRASFLWLIPKFHGLGHASPQTDSWFSSWKRWWPDLKIMRLGQTGYMHFPKLKDRYSLLLDYRSIFNQSLSSVHIQWAPLDRCSAYGPIRYRPYHKSGITNTV